MERKNSLDRIQRDGTGAAEESDGGIQKLFVEREDRAGVCGSGGEDGGEKGLPFSGKAFGGREDSAGRG